MTNSLRKYTGIIRGKISGLIIFFSKYNYFEKIILLKANQLKHLFSISSYYLERMAYKISSSTHSFLCLPFVFYFPSFPPSFLPACLLSSSFSSFFILSFFADMYSNFSNFALWLKAQSLSENTFYHFSTLFLH